MADANWMKKAPPATEDSSDPFEELTRIMGFDPRVPFRGSQAGESRVAPQHVAAPQVDVTDDDLDLAIDLEQELMGALEPEFSSAAPASHGLHAEGYAGVRSQQRYQAPAYAEEEPSLDQEAYGDVSPAGFAETQHHPERNDLPQEEWTHPEPAYDADDAYQSEVAQDQEIAYANYAAAVENDHPASRDAAEEAMNSLESEIYAVADQSYADEGQGAHGEAHVAANDEFDDFDHGAALAADLDDALVASFENALSDQDDEWVSPADRDEGEADERAESVAANHVAPQYAHDFAGDAAMAEVDMDFTAAPAPAALPPAEDANHDASLQSDFESDLESLLADNLDAGASQGSYEARRAVAEDVYEEEAASEPTRGWEDARAYAAPGAGYAFADARAEDARLEEYGDTAAEYEPQPYDLAGDEPQGHGTAVEEDIDDAIAELAAMVRGYDRPQQADAAVEHYARGEEDPTAQAVEDIPDIETVDVPEEAVALADDLEIPEVEYAEDAAPSFDHLDAELAAAFGEPAIETVQTVQTSQAEPPAAPSFDLESGYDVDAGRAAAFAAASFGAGAAAGAMRYQQQVQGQSADFQVRREATTGAAYEAGVRDFQVDPDLEDDLALAGELQSAQRPSSRRGLIIASIVGGIAVIGAVGAYALSGGGGTGEPALVRADTDPVKVKPENPGGVTVPNQESRVFDRAAGVAPQQPNQEALISNEEEPVDMAERFPQELPQSIGESADGEDLAAADAPMGDDRIEQAIAADQRQPVEEVPAVAPRKVRTMIVKPDGTLVPREDVLPEPQSVGSTTAAGSLTDPTISPPPAAEQALDQPSPDGAAPATAAQQAPPAEAAPAPSSEATAVATPTASGGSQQSAPSSMPDRVPVAPSRPAEQPLDIVGEVKPDQVAALSTEAPAAGSWAVQIASQPSEAAARSTYQDLSRRYSSVLGDRSAHIVKAEIAGKGTFWRVRVPAGSRNEAIKLCESYKAAGGNCFVSK